MYGTSLFGVRVQKGTYYFGFCATHILSDSDLAILSVQATHVYRPYILLSLRVRLNAANEREISAPAKGSNSTSLVILPHNITH